MFSCCSCFSTGGPPIALRQQGNGHHPEDALECFDCNQRQKENSGKLIGNSPPRPSLCPLEYRSLRTICGQPTSRSSMQAPSHNPALSTEYGVHGPTSSSNLSHFRSQIYTEPRVRGCPVGTLLPTMERTRQARMIQTDETDDTFHHLPGTSS